MNRQSQLQSSVLAAPAFVLGLKLDRFLKDTLIINPEVLVLDHAGKPLEGLEFHLRLMHRQWHSYLKESDFTTGKAEYVTDVVDVPLIRNKPWFQPLNRRDTIIAC